MAEAIARGREPPTGTISPTAVTKQETLKALFQLAAEWVKNHHKESSASNEVLLKLYGLYKRVNFGACNTKQPNLLDPRGRARYFAWKYASDMGEDQARRVYVDLVRFNFPEFAKTYETELAAIEDTRNIKDEYEMLLVHSNTLLQIITKMAGQTLVKKGDLFVYNLSDVGIGYNRKWQLRFLVLEGSTLNVYENRTTPVPSRTYELGGCGVIMEPPKKGGKYHILSVTTVGTNQEMLIRLSTESEVDAKEWGDALNRACLLGQYHALNQEFKERGEKEHPSDLHLRRQVSQGVIAMTAVTKESAGPVVAEQGKGKTLSLASRLPSRPVHRAVRASLLSAESPVQNYSGLVNLFVLIVITANFQLLVGKLRQGLTGLRAPVLSQWSLPADWTLWVCLLFLWVYFFIALGIEKLALYNNKVSPGSIVFLRATNSLVSLLFPSYLAWVYPENTYTAVVLLFVDVITFLKVVSFHACNADLRRIHLSRNLQDDNAKPVDGSDQGYPANLTVENVVYFILAPTLVYQPQYPRTPRIRKRVVLSLVLQMLVVAAIQALVVDSMQGTIMSTLAHVRDKLLALGPLKGMQRWFFYKLHVIDLYTVEKLLGLAVPCTYVWLLGFYLYFHLWLNLMSEILRFGDREFYREWWNATTLSVYWRTWNMPVHGWVVRHIYFPALRYGFSSFWSSMIVFSFSAIMHEWVVAIPLHAWKGYAFFAMALQVPLIFLMDWVDLNYLQPWEYRRAGNVVFWLVFCIFGQPLIVILIYWHIYVQNEGLLDIIYPS